MNRWIVTGTIFTILGLLAVAAYSQMSEWPGAPKLKLDHVSAPARTIATSETQPPENVVKLLNANDDREITIARLSKAQPTPSTRADYFQSVLKNPDFRLTKWYLSLIAVKTADAGTRFTVRAIPLVRSSFAGATLINGFLDETYELNGEDLRLVNTVPAVDPAVVRSFDFDGF